MAQKLRNNSIKLSNRFLLELNIPEHGYMYILVKPRVKLFLLKHNTVKTLVKREENTYLFTYSLIAKLVSSFSVLLFFGHDLICIHGCMSDSL